MYYNIVIWTHIYVEYVAYYRISYDNGFGACGVGPCCDWEEFLGDKLGNTSYADMPNSIRPGKVFHRGSRGGKKGGSGKKGENMENSEGESSSEEEGQCS